MIASISCTSWRTARITDSGDPPTPTQIGTPSGASVGNSCASFSGARVCPCHVTDGWRSILTRTSSFSSNSCS